MLGLIYLASGLKPIPRCGGPGITYSVSGRASFIVYPHKSLEMKAFSPD
jgi:hypothetical protein